MKPFFRVYYSPAFQSAQLDERRIALPPSLRALKSRTILFMTDLHASVLFPPRALEALINQANALRPDLVLLGGDLAETARDQAEALPLLGRLNAPLGVYTVMGNNDYHHAQSEEEVRRAAAAGPCRTHARRAVPSAGADAVLDRL